VTEPQVQAKAEGNGMPSAATAGTLLACAREASGLSIDAVAQQLKLAPRQVRALEEDDYTHQPGRTFVRGFARNYARLVHIDPDAVVGALPVGAAAPALEAPTLQPTAPTMGELPTTDHSKPAWARWAIPLTLAAIVAVAAVYEWLRPAGVARQTPDKETVAVENPSATAVPPGATGTPLSNPLVAGKPAGESIPPPEPAPTGGSTPPPAVTAATPATTAAVSGSEQSITIAFRDFSWTEIRDRDGRLVLSGMNAGGTVQNLSGTPPFDIVIGNAEDVRLTYKGNPVDLAPHTRQNVARFKLP
jgi:cytoskeleton protein RodZ